MRNNGERGTKCDAAGKPKGDSLTEKDLPILRALSDEKGEDDERDAR